MAVIKNDKDVLLQAASLRVIGTEAVISLSNGKFTTLKNNGGTTPASITLTAASSVFTGAAVKTWHYALNTSPNTWVSLGTGNTKTITNSDCLTAISGTLASSIVYRLTITEFGFADATGYNSIAYVREADDGMVATLASTSNTVPANSSGVVSSFPTGNTLSLYRGSTLLSSGVTFSGSTTKNGLTLSINSSTGAITLSQSSWSTTSESFTLTATYNSIGYTTVYNISKAVAGAAGSNGTNGTNGAVGTRGTITTKITGSWNSTTAAAAVSAIATAAGSTPTNPIKGDIVYYNGGANECTVAGSPGTWAAVAAFIDGSLVATGTIAAGVSFNTSGYVVASGTTVNTTVGGYTTTGSFGLSNSSVYYGAVGVGYAIGLAGLSTTNVGGAYAVGVYGRALKSTDTAIYADAYTSGATALVAYGYGGVGKAISATGTASISGATSIGATLTCNGTTPIVAGNTNQCTNLNAQYVGGFGINNIVTRVTGYMRIGGASTGAGTGTYTATNKPGASNTNTWLDFDLGGVQYVIPIWAV